MTALTVCSGARRVRREMVAKVFSSLRKPPINNNNNHNNAIISMYSFQLFLNLIQYQLICTVHSTHQQPTKSPPPPPPSTANLIPALRHSQPHTHTHKWVHTGNEAQMKRRSGSSIQSIRNKINNYLNSHIIIIFIVGEIYFWLYVNTLGEVWTNVRWQNQNNNKIIKM